MSPKLKNLATIEAFGVFFRRAWATAYTRVQMKMGMDEYIV